MTDNIKLIIAGSRDFTDYAFLCQIIDRFLNDCSPASIEIVSGTARGADMLGERYAKEHNIALKRFPADWNKYGKSAGYRRNVDMAKYANACFVFWDGSSRGSKHMIDIATDNGLYTEYFIYK